MMFRYSFLSNGWSTIVVIGLSLILSGISISCQQEVKIPEPEVAAEQGIDELMKNLKTMKKEVASPLEGIHTSYQELQLAKNRHRKTNDEIRRDLLSPIKTSDQADFKRELETIYDVGKEKKFFLRQIEYAQLKIDLAVVGIGIIRVHQVLRGENPSVKPKDTQEFIRYIKEQVQNALISQDKNYKAIVFKGLESSA